MLRDAVGGECYLVAGGEIFDSVATALALRGTHRDDERNFHFVGVAYLVAHFLAGEVDRDRDIFPAQVLREPYRMVLRALIHDGYHALRPRRVRGKEIVGLEEIARGHIAHCESHRWHLFCSEEGKQVVVATATEKRAAVLSARVEDLKYHAGVVIKAPRDLR